MGQYYRALLENVGTDKRKNIECKGFKLMEHSYIGNETMNFIEKLIAGEPTKIWWVGDYAYQASKTVNNMTVGEHMEAYNLAWDSISALPLIDDYDCKKRNKKYKYLVNWIKSEYIDLDKYNELYFDKCFSAAINPLSLLTCISNGIDIDCGGDYTCPSSPNKEYVGWWAGDRISLECEIANLSNCTEKYEFREIYI